jgi:hypothetical protein
VKLFGGVGVKGQRLAVTVLSGARGGRCREMVGRLWWTPEPGPLLVQTSRTIGYLVPRDLRYEPVLMGCASCDGNKGHNREDVYVLLRKPFGDYVRTGKKQTVTRRP